jgi:hypothetical protein
MCSNGLTGEKYIQLNASKVNRSIFQTRHLHLLTHGIKTDKRLCLEHDKYFMVFKTEGYNDIEQ